MTVAQDFQNKFAQPFTGIEGLIAFFLLTIVFYALNIWKLMEAQKYGNIAGCDVEKILALNWTAIFALLIPVLLFVVTFGSLEIGKDNIDKGKAQLTRSCIFLLSLMNISIAGVNFDLVAKQVKSEELRSQTAKDKSDSRIKIMNDGLISINFFLLASSALMLTASTGAIYADKKSLGFETLRANFPRT